MEKYEYQKRAALHPFFKLTTIILAVFLVSMQVYHAFNFPIWRDDAWFAIVAKNLAANDGYSMVLFDKNYPFHVLNSSGPILILPAALLIFIFNNHFWVPSLANILLIWTFLIAIFAAAGAILSKERKWLFCFLFLLFGLLFSAGSFGSYSVETNDIIALWHLLMGEVSASLCMILSAFLLLSPTTTIRKTIVGATIGGFALMIKTITALALPAIMAMFTLKIFLSKNFRKSEKIKFILLALLLISLPICSFELVKMISLGWKEFITLKLQSAYVYKSQAYLNNSKSLLTSNAAKRLLWEFNGKYCIVAFLSIYVVYLSCKEKIFDNFAHLVGLTLIFCFCLHSLWWVFFSTGSDRHFVPALFYYCCAMALFIASFDYKNQPYINKNIIFLLVFLLLCARSDAFNNLLFRGFESNKRLKEQLLITDAVNDLKKEKITLISCGNNFELEYLASGSKNFKHCSYLLDKSFAPNSVMLVSYYVLPKLEVTLMDDWYAGRVQAQPDYVLLRCNEDYLVTENFSLRWCR